LLCLSSTGLLTRLSTETQAQIEELSGRIATDATRLEELQTAQMENSRGILKAQKAVERYITKRQTLLTRKDECNKSIRDLGVLPEEAYTKYVKEPSEKVSFLRFPLSCQTEMSSSW
jgi:structural maintenance of chromosome 3 (chondroitin sulfate proteoglycan 6)